jgi:hypothetical protein
MSADNPSGTNRIVGASLLANAESIFASKLAPTRSKTKMDNPE